MRKAVSHQGWRTLHRLAVALALLASVIGTTASAQPVLSLAQGGKWSPAARDAFYTIDQGSRLIPYRWAQALQRPDGSPFLADGLARYGYLPNPASPTPGLPIGFMVAPDADGPSLAMNCAACHTRQIEAGGQVWRIDGGPAFSDFAGLLTDLDAAVSATLSSDAAFARFAAAVLGGQPTGLQIAALRRAVEAWHVPFHTIIATSLPRPGLWGIGRLDAISMIFNRVAGLDLGPASAGGMIPANILPADAPARYPFLWNASIQDRIQWPGFAPNGSPIFALTRNTGEVLGVFGRFHPRKTLFGVDYKTGSSISLPGLWNLETLITKIGPPAFPGPVDAALAQKGAAIFARPGPSEPSCDSCHGIAPGGLRPPSIETWRTPAQDVGTDTREWQVLGRKVDPGVLAGAFVPLSFPPEHLPTADAPAALVLKVAVLGAIVDQLPTLVTAKADLSALGQGPTAAPDIADLLNWFRDPTDLPKPPPPGQFPYESRVLQGIWATAPYLHNGSVPTLADLLKPAADRPASFAVGRAYDLARLGLATTQPTGPTSTLTTTGCEARNSGNSRCGHEFGVWLSPDDKAALLEYLKTL